MVKTTHSTTAQPAATASTSPATRLRIVFSGPTVDLYMVSSMEMS